VPGAPALAGPVAGSTTDWTTRGPVGFASPLARASAALPALTPCGSRPNLRFGFLRPAPGSADLRRESGRGCSLSAQFSQELRQAAPDRNLALELDRQIQPNANLNSAEISRLLQEHWGTGPGH